MTGAFDAHQPPDAGQIGSCIHCGLCLPTCPTYVVWGEEMDSPRGRIVLMRHGLEPGGVMDPMAIHFDRCLGCMACVTACPSGVPYDRLIEAVRPQVERHHRRPLRDQVLRRFCFEVFTHPGRLRALVPLAPVLRRLGRRPVLARFPRLAALARITPPARLRSAWRRLPEHSAAPGTSRGRVGLLQGCVARVFFAGVNEATVRVLTAEGFDVFAPGSPRCCGALQLHSGDEPPALALARETIAAFEACEVVVANAAGCGSAMRDYGHLLAGDPAWAERAARFSAKVRDISEFLAGVEPRATRHALPMTVAYHDACHLAHAQKVRAEPRALLAGIPALTVAEPAEWELCCGSAGLYNVFQPEAAGQLGTRKAANLAATGADAVVAGNPGCALQITAHLQAAGNPVPVHHPVELLDASIRGTRRP